MTFSVTTASVADLPDIARIHVRSWQQTYAGLVPQSFLDTMDVAARQKSWQQIFEGKASEDNNLFVARDGSDTVGFVSFGRARDARKEGWGEIYAIYLLREHWGQGMGHALFDKARMSLQAAGRHAAYLWVLNTNTNAIRAYEKWGGVVDTSVVMKGVIGSQPIEEVMVAFDWRHAATGTPD